ADAMTTNPSATRAAPRRRAQAANAAPHPATAIAAEPEPAPARPPASTPTTRAATTSTGPAARRTSDGDEGLQLREAAFADAVHLLELVHGPEPALAGALRDDRLRERGSDAGERLELGLGRGVEVERARRRRARAVAAGRGRVGRGRRIADVLHQHPLAVDHLRGEVQAIEVGAGQRTARRLDGVDHA